MALTPSNMIPLGSNAPDFHLQDVVSGNFYSLEKLRGTQATVVMFICNHCPFVKHINNGLVSLAKDYKNKGVSFIAISSNDAINYPEDAPDKMKELALASAYPFPYLYDESQAVAKAYDAACTPDFYIFDNQLKLVYRGQLDDARPSNNIPVTGSDMRKALDSIFNGVAVDPFQRPSIGCNIKWKN